MSTQPQSPLLDPWASDMYAPSWAAVTPQRVSGICDVQFDYGVGVNGIPIAVTVAAGAVLLGRTNSQLQIQVDTDADFFAREIFIAPVGGSVGNANPSDLKVRLTDADGNAITSDWCTANDLCGPVGPVPLTFRKGGLIFFDVWNQGTSTLLVQIGLKGFKRFPCTETQPPIPRFRSIRELLCREWPGVRFEDYEYFFQFARNSSAFFPPWTNVLNSTTMLFAQFPLQTDTDSSFLWRGITGIIQQTGGGYAQIPQQAFLGFYDYLTVPLSNTIPRLNQAPALAPPGAEMVLSNGGGRMIPHFPEILIPPGGVIPVDILVNFASGVNSVEFSLRGLKVYSEALCS